MIKNFLFHRVNPIRDRLWDPMDVKLFDRCIKYISSHFEIVQFEQLVTSGNLLSQKKYATIMFDDGYKDNIEYAADILSRYKATASFYVVTDCIDKNIPTWTHILENTFQFTKKSRIDLDLDFLPQQYRISELPGTEDRIRYINQFKPYLKQITHENRAVVMQKVMSAFDDVEVQKIMMNWQDVKQLRDAGHYIGSHTVSHCVLGTMTDEDEITRELSLSAKIIEQQLGYFPSTISYPVGSYNQETIRLSKKAGYSIGLAVGEKTFDPYKYNLFEIPRIQLGNESWLKTKLRINSTFENLKSILKSA